VSEKDVYIDRAALLAHAERLEKAVAHSPASGQYMAALLEQDRLRSLVTELVEALDLAVFALDGKCTEHTMATLRAVLAKARGT
jgi:hypothetical protein